MIKQKNIKTKVNKQIEQEEKANWKKKIIGCHSVSPLFLFSYYSLTGTHTWVSGTVLNMFHNQKNKKKMRRKYAVCVWVTQKPSDSKSVNFFTPWTTAHQFWTAKHFVDLVSCFEPSQPLGVLWWSVSALWSIICTSTKGVWGWKQFKDQQYHTQFKPFKHTCMHLRLNRACFQTSKWQEHWQVLHFLNQCWHIPVFVLFLFLYNGWFFFFFFFFWMLKKLRSFLCDRKLQVFLLSRRWSEHLVTVFHVQQYCTN